MLLSLAAMLSACGGGGSGSLTTGGGTTGGGTPIGGGGTPTPTANGCSLSERKTWVANQMNEWYLFPETLPASLNAASYTTVQDYLDALTATARAQGRDRYFTYITSIAEENAYYNSGSSAGFGFRLAYDPSSQRIAIIEAFENAPALNAGLDRGTEILAIGTSASTLQDISALVASGGTDAVSQALGPDTVGTTRALRVTDAGGTRVVTLTKTDFTLTPVSSRYGAKIITDGGQRYGYINLRTFINTAETPLRNAFADFRAQGITNVIIDVRYNGGGLISIAELMGDLMGANRSTSDVFDYMTFRASKSSENEVNYFAPQPQSIAPTRIAFIGTRSSASASELVMNGFIPYLGSNTALVGTNTYGKPVGQIALDRTACDDRLRVIAFAVENRDHQSNYYNGIASVMPRTCQAADDISRPLGDPTEASTRAAIDFLAGRSCTPIGTTSQARNARSAAANTTPDGRDLLAPPRPSTAQRKVPGLF